MRITTLVALGLVVLAVACGGDNAKKYDLTINFNTSIQPEDYDDAFLVLDPYDPNLELRIQESFPPTGRGVVTTKTSDFCSEIEQKLMAKTYVDAVTCEPYVEPTGGLGGDTPVGATPIGSPRPNE